MTASCESRPSAVSLALRYATGFTFAYLLTTAELIATVVSLCAQTHSAASSLLDRANLIPLIVAVAVGTVAIAIAAYRGIIGTARWYAAGLVPDDAQRQRANTVLHRQALVVITVWLFGAAILIAGNRQPIPASLVGLSAIFGALSTVSTGILFTQRGYRPLAAAASADHIGRTTTPGVRTRLVLMWVMNSALPSVFIVVLIVCRHMGWFMPKAASVDIPVVVVSLVSLGLGLRALIGAAGIVLLLIGAGLYGYQHLQEQRAREKARLELQAAELAAAVQLCDAGSHAVAWKQFTAVAASRPGDAAVRTAREDCGMRWLREMRVVGDKQTFSEQVEDRKSVV